jgi:hypothetical protein
MIEMIFFGGLVAGFLIGWIGMALLTMASLHNRQKILVERASASHEDCRN